MIIRCHGSENGGGCREDGIVLGKPLLVQGTPPGRGHVSGEGVQFFRKAVRVEMFRVPLHRVSTTDTHYNIIIICTILYVWFTRVLNVVRLRYNKLLHISRTKRKQKLRNDSQNRRVVGRLTYNCGQAHWVYRGIYCTTWRG